MVVVNNATTRFHKFKRSGGLITQLGHDNKIGDGNQWGN